MGLGTIAFFLGTALYSTAFFPFYIQSIWKYFFLLIALLLSIVFRRISLIKLLCIFSIGFLWALIVSSHLISPLYPALENKTISVIGTVASIPEQESSYS